MPTVTVKLTDEEFAALSDPLFTRKFISKSDIIRHALNNLFIAHKLKKKARDAIEQSRRYNRHPPRRRHPWSV